MTANGSPVLPAPIHSFEALVAQFDYPRMERIPTEMTSIEHHEGVVVHDLSYAGKGEEQRIPAFMVTPEGDGPFPGVIYVHPAPGDRTTFLEEAVQLGKRGTASLLVRAPWYAGEEWASTLKTPEYTREVFTAIIQDLRRAVDFIETRPEFDSSRLAFVGHSLGAVCGGVLSGVEKRIKAFALLAGAPSFTDVAALNNSSLKGEELEQYARVIQPIDPVYYVGHAAPAALLFQFGEKDEAFSREQFERLALAGSEPKLVRWYDAGHFFENGEGLADRMEWLLAMMITG